MLRKPRRPRRFRHGTVTWECADRTVTSTLFVRADTIGRLTWADVLPSGTLTCLTPSMSETDGLGDIDVTIETEVIDVDGDGVADLVIETTTTLIDGDGDGVRSAGAVGPSADRDRRARPLHLDCRGA